ncbi:hypothetical protein LIER_22588 [Lithospermum erythrorhizon]|uniref:Transposase MuDR plant domain-containing protein n=1 Tax=Lithospermum erythrorhizon TaxID=34254 RepID=A0AAV3QXW4_LITER
MFHHPDLDHTLRVEVANGEIRLDYIGDDDDNDVDKGLGINQVDEDYNMKDDDALFDMHVDEGAEEGGSSFSHTDLLSSRVHEELNEDDGERDCLGVDNEGFRSDKGPSEDDGYHAKQDNYPKYNSQTNSRNPKSIIGMLFSCTEELKDAIYTYNIKDARNVKYVRNVKNRVTVVCKDKRCKWFTYARKLSSETGLQIRKWQLDHTCIPVYDNKTLTTSWLAKHYVKKFRNSPTYKPSNFRKKIGLKLDQHVSRWQAFRAKVVAMKSIYGDEVEQYSSWN